MPIRNIVRATGGSHYGIGRTFRVLFDIITIKFLLSYLTRPMHFFGKFGLGWTVVGGLMLAYLAARKLTGHEILVEHGPLMLASAPAAVSGLMMFTTGLAR